MRSIFDICDGDSYYEQVRVPNTPYLLRGVDDWGTRIEIAYCETGKPLPHVSCAVMCAFALEPVNAATVHRIGKWLQRLWHAPESA